MLSDRLFCAFKPFQSLFAARVWVVRNCAPQPSALGLGDLASPYYVAFLPLIYSILHPLGRLLRQFVSIRPSIIILNLHVGSHQRP